MPVLQYLKPFILLLIVTLVACGSDSPSQTQSSDSDNTENTQNAVDNGAGMTPIPLEDASIFMGTWTRNCFTAADSASLGTMQSFIYDGTRAAFITEFFQDVDCLQSTGVIVDSGFIEFNGVIVESTFGVTANIFTFVSAEPESIGFKDIVYTDNEQLFLGDENSRSTSAQHPMALNFALPYEYSGVPNFSIVDVVQ